MSRAVKIRRPRASVEAPEHTAALKEIAVNTQ